ncbi:helix-turn-helix transcriptional regulator [Phytoactinopolyspora halotolerans]|uniref:AAA family ATPase n=1 Tax=Phytoactinopolyspora halotolerans TaxID=1981512 RepID=A0A6L9SGQ9_9ACTN|nr:LuxR family transcriptional regulator [Phytoactinopolyspora halotolerans]NEE03290.1 AAA family ATPase [Phytoactinopolyspora halotolerans]
MDLQEGDGLVGRAPERRRIAALIDRLHAGMGGALVVVGAAGIGKSALLRSIADDARNGEVAGGLAGSGSDGDGRDGRGDAAVAVTHVAGAEAEREWPYSGLHLVLSSAVGPLRAAGHDAVAGRLRELMDDVRADSDPYEVATRVQECVGGMSPPLLVLVDDAHVLDRRSQEVLGFVARRLGTVPAAMVLVADGDSLTAPFRSIPAMVVEELSSAEAVRLVRERAGVETPRRVAEQIVARAGGNPRTLVEVVARTPRAQLTGRVQLDRYLPRTPVLEALGAELAELDDARRVALIIAAASDDGQLGPVLKALDGYDPAIAEWLLGEYLTEFEDRFLFRRPAVASAAWLNATHRERQQAHTALACAYENRDRDRQLWHLAQARYDEDAELADELQRVSRERLRHGEVTGATAYARESIRLMPATSDRVDRLVYAGGLALLDGRIEDAIELARERFRVETAVEQRADLALLEVRARNQLDGDVAAGVITRHADEVGGVDPNRAARLNLFAAYGFAGRLEPAEANRFLHLAERHVEHFDDTTRAVHQRIAAWLATIDGDGAGAAALLADSRTAGNLLVESDAHIAHAMALIRLERFGEARRLLQATALDGRIGQSPLLRGNSFAVLTVLEARAGRLTAAKLAATAWEETGITGLWRAAVPAHMIRVYGLMGDDELAWECRDRAVEGSRRHADSWANALVQAETGALLLLLGRLDEALSVLAHARRYALGYADPSVVPVEPEYIEACVRAGATVSAQSALADFEQRTVKTPTVWAQHTLMRCQALLGDGKEALALFQKALRNSTGVSPVEMARTTLCLGERLRRMGQRVDAGRWLHRALVMAQECGAAALVARAEVELQAAGRRARVESADVDLLTEAEQRIASLVADGRRNREIAAALFVSVRTVETHLSRIFRKLGVRSRTELAAAFRAADDGTEEPSSADDGA